MRVIVTGATGLVGSAVLRRCVADPAVTSVIALCRKPLPEAVTSSEKVTVIIHDNFGSYPPELLDKLAGSDGCIWCIGGRVSDQFKGDVALAHKVQVDYTVAAAKAFVSALAPQTAARGSKFRFVFCSGQYAQQDQDKTLLFMSDTRRLKGLAEKQLLELADINRDEFEVYCARPSGILPPDAPKLQHVVGLLYNAIGADELAAALLSMCRNGYPKSVIENGELKKMA